MKVKAIIERGTDGTYSIFLDDDTLDFLIIGDGNTIAEAKEDFFIAQNEIKAAYEEQGRAFPDLDFVFHYDTASFLNYYIQIIPLEGLERLTGIKQIQLNQYLRGETKPNIKTTKKIQQHLHAFGKELQHLHFV